MHEETLLASYCLPLSRSLLCSLLCLLSCSQYKDTYDGCNKHDLGPAEIRSEEENEAALRLDKRIREEVKTLGDEDEDVVLLGATDEQPKDGTWYWMSQVVKSDVQGPPIFFEPTKTPYNEAEPLDNPFHKFCGRELYPSL